MSAPLLKEVLEACSQFEGGRAFSADLHVHSTVSDGSDSAGGGYAVLAHPGQPDSWDIAGDLASCGLSGIEAAHPDHDACDERRASDVAEAYGLFCTAGSDRHGRFGAVPHVGFRRVEG